MPDTGGSARPTEDSGPPKVLLCDDAVAFSAIFRVWMRKCGVEVVAEAETGADAVVRAREHQPNVIVIDHLLRDTTSDALVPRLREAVPASKLLLISGMPDDHLAAAARAAGADAYLSKAASAQAMCDAVLGLLHPPAASGTTRAQR